MNLQLIHLAYFVASLLFILGLRGMGDPKAARRGMGLAALGMLIAVVGTLLHHEIITFKWIALGVLIGGGIGVAISISIPMTKMPERIALSHSFGGLAVALVGVSEYVRHMGLLGQSPATGLHMTAFQMGAVSFELLLGAITFTGSVMAFGKLQGIIAGRPLTFKGLNALNLTMLAAGVGLVIYMVMFPDDARVFYSIAVLGLVLGVSLVLPIGGADMPVIICLLNSYAGLAASASGFALGNNVLIICGALDGGSGFILAMLMSKAMNRSFANVIFGAFGTDGGAPAAVGAGAAAAPVNEASVEEAAELLKAATSVIVIPGYGMAVSQAQHAVRDLASVLTANGATVRYAIHPVAGRMPGHMNVLLAEANIPYEQLFDLDDINNDFAQTDVALVVGANDVVNPAAKSNPGSPIYGMPVLNADQARTVMVLKRSMNTGFAGIENELFVQKNTMMVLGDAKKTLTSLTTAVKAA
ncbi:MAG: NAD(P)(+) transhydrogenase (Re/Si-specific) subunit beta [Deltaproteobacteria bacterium]|nr:NAD(P)(+) transhydrogenase (Re/Si-specific) subunit beta [Deltaproteobacteria bacterium]